ncbi:MAG: GxxExxY protein [Crocinitomicaceae bacterium]|nr:GxxExxY protein [Crocinitomicaceae bacterium]
MKMTKKYLDELTYDINGAAIEVHKELGPGLLESVCHKCLAYELWLRGINYEIEVELPVKYKMIEIDTKLRCDLFVENCIVIELKAVDNFHPVHSAQLLTYMKLLEVPKGILINFNAYNLFKDGQRTFINDRFKKLPKE